MKTHFRVVSSLVCLLTLVITFSASHAAQSAVQGSTFDVDQLPVISAANVAQLRSIGQYAQQGEIKNVAVSPRNTALAISGSLGVWIYRIAGYFGGATILTTDSASTSAAISRDERFAAAGSADGTIQLDQFVVGKVTLTKTLTGHSGAVNTLAFSPDGQTLASGGADKTVRLWATTPNVTVDVTLEGHTDAITSVAFSPDGKTLASASADKTVRLWSLTTGQVAFVLSGHSDTVTSVAFSPDGKTLASASADKTVRLWNVSSGQLLLTLTGATNGLSGVTFSLDGQTVAAPGLDGSVQRWQVADGKALAPLKDMSDSLIGAASPIGNLFFSASRTDSTIVEWDTTTGNIKQRALYADSLSGSFSPDSKSIAITNNDGTIIRTITTGQTATSFKLAGTHSVFSPDFKTAASISDQYVGDVHLTNIASGQVTDLGQVVTLGVNFAFSPDGKLLAFEDAQGVGVLWDTGTGKVFGHLKGHTNYLTRITFSPDGKQVVAGAQDGTILLWNVADQQLIATVSTSAGIGYALAFSPDGKTIAYTDSKKFLNLWDVASQQPIGTIDHVSQFAFSPDGQLIATLDGSGTLSFWHTADRSPIREVTDGVGTASIIAFSPDGKLLTTQDEYTIRLWAVSTGSLPTVSVTPIATAATTSPNATMAAASSASTSTPRAAATQSPTNVPGTTNSAGNVITYDTAVHGEIKTSTTQVSYVLTGTKNDVVEALITSVTPKGAKYAFSPKFNVKDASGLLVDSSQGGSTSHGITDQSGVTTYYSTYFFALRQDAPATLTLAANQQSIGTFDVVLHRIPLITLDTSVTGQIDYKTLAANTPAVLYAFKDDTAFSLDYQVTGMLNVTVEVNQLQPNGSLLPLGLLGGASSDGFSPKASASFSGGTLIMKATAPVYLITLGNGIANFDDPQTFFAQGKDTDTAQYRFVVHASTGNSAPTAAATSNASPAVTMTATAASNMVPIVPTVLSRIPVVTPTMTPVAAVSLANEGLLALYTPFQGIILTAPGNPGTAPLTIKTLVNNKLAWSANGRQIFYSPSALTLCGTNVPSTAGAAANPDCVNLTVQANVLQIDDFALSPDGATLAFAMRVSGPNKTQYYSQLYTANADGTNLRALTDGTFGDLSPNFTQNGKQIIFNREIRGAPTGINHIYAINVDGSNLAEIKTGVAEPNRPALSPDGKYLAVSSQTKIGAIYLVNLANGQARQLTRTATDTRTIGGKNCGVTLDQYPSWSADGAYIAFLALNNCSIDVYVARIDNGAVQPILTGQKLGASLAWQPVTR